MKTIFENVIERGGYDLTGLLNRIDSYHVMGKLTDEERDELYAKARAGARDALRGSCGEIILCSKKLKHG